MSFVRFPQKFILIFLVIILVVVAAGASLRSNVFAWQSLPLVGQLAETSKVRVFLSGQQVVTQFQITPFDQENLTKFSQSLEFGEDFVQGFTISIDDKTSDSLKDFLPLEASLKILPKEVMFSSNGWNGLSKIPLNNELFQSAYQEGKIKVEDLGGGNFQIDIENPAQVLSDATISGKLRLSEQLIKGGLWQRLSKFARISLKVGNRSVEGVATLY